MYVGRYRKCTFMRFLPGRNRERINVVLATGSAGLNVHLRLLVAIFFVSLLMLVPSCSEISGTDGLHGAIEDGIIIPPGWVIAGDDTFNLVAAERADIVQTVELTVRAWFPTGYSAGALLTFEEYGGIYSGPLVSEVGTVVQRGDLLATQVFQHYPTFESDIRGLDRQRLLFQIEDFENSFREEYSFRNLEIAELKEEIAHETDSLLAGLRLERLITQLEFFLFESNQTRRGFEVQLEELSDGPYEERLYAPFDGMIVSVTTWSAGRRIPANQPLFAILNPRSIQFHVQTRPYVLNFGRTYTIREANGAFEFKARIINDPFTVSWSASATDFYLAPYDMDAFMATIDGLGLTIIDVLSMVFRITAVETIAHSAIVIPVRAIRREDRFEYVLIYNEGRLSKRYITRGVQYLSDVQVLIGLSEGQRVVLP